jgi:hypothetical protein
MTLHYYRILYSDDLGTGKESTIGIIAHDGQRAYFRALGVRNRQDIDPSPLCHQTMFRAEDAWAYREWMDWFYDVTDNECVNPAGFEKVMALLQRTGTTLTVEFGGHVAIPAAATALEVLDRLYHELVSPE